MFYLLSLRSVISSLFDKGPAGGKGYSLKVPTPVAFSLKKEYGRSIKAVLRPPKTTTE